MNNYRIVGADQKEYGPVSFEDLRRWILEGRANAQTRVLAEGSSDWTTLGQLPEFAEILSQAPPPLSAASASAYGASSTTPGFDPLPPDVETRDWDLDIGGIISRSYELLKSNFGAIFGLSIVYILVQFGISALTNIPILGILVAVASLVIYGPLMGGLYFSMVRFIRGEQLMIGELFSGFRIQFGQLALCYIVMSLVIGLSLLPGAVLMVIGIFMTAQMPSPEALQIALIAVGVILLLIPAVYFSISWMFALPLVIDKGLDFWPALGLSRRVVSKHFWLAFGFLIVIGLINLAGFIACCVGFLFTFPLTMLALMYAYEALFSARRAY